MPIGEPQSVSGRIRELREDGVALVTRDAPRTLVALIFLPEREAAEVCEYIALMRRENGNGDALNCYTLNHAQISAFADTQREITA